MTQRKKIIKLFFNLKGQSKLKPDQYKSESIINRESGAVT